MSSAPPARWRGFSWPTPRRKQAAPVDPDESADVGQGDRRELAKTRRIVDLFSELPASRLFEFLESSRGR
jgi:hypothetical protein